MLPAGLEVPPVDGQLAPDGRGGLGGPVDLDEGQVLELAGGEPDEGIWLQPGPAPADPTERSPTGWLGIEGQQLAAGPGLLNEGDVELGDGQRVGQEGRPRSPGPTNPQAAGWTADTGQALAGDVEGVDRLGRATGGAANAAIEFSQDVMVERPV